MEAGPGEEAVRPAAGHLGRSATVMAFGTTLSRITGLGRFMALAFALGVTESKLADTFNLANIMPNVVYELVLGGVLTSVFIPVLVEELRTKPKDEAWRGASSLATVSLAVLVTLAVVIAIAAPWIIRLFTQRVPGAEAAAQQEVATFLLRCFAPQVVFYGFAALAGGLLNAHDRFAAPMFAPILNNVIMIATLLIFAAVVSGTPTNQSISMGPKLLLGLGTTAGVLGMAAVHWPFLRQLPGRLRTSFDFRHPAVRKLARLSTWTVGYVVTNQIGLGVALYLANRVQGGPTAYFTAFAFFQLPYGVVAVSVITALVPTMSAQFVDGDDDGFRARAAGGLRAIALILLPATAAYLVLSRPLVKILLERGIMTGASTEVVAGVLDMFAIGLVPFAAFLLFVRAFYARQDARTPMVVNVAGTAATVVLCVALFGDLDVRGLALAHSLGYVVAAGVAGAVLSHHIGGLHGRKTLLELGKMAVAATAAGLAMALAVELVGDAVGGDTVEALVQFAVAGVLGFLVFVTVARLLAVEDLALVRRLLPRRARGIIPAGAGRASDQGVR